MPFEHAHWEKLMCRAQWGPLSSLSIRVRKPVEVAPQNCRAALLHYCAVALKAVVQGGYLEHVLKNDLFLMCLVPGPGGRVFLQIAIKRTVTGG